MRKQTEKQSGITSTKTLVDRLDAKASAGATLKDTDFKQVIEAYLEVAARGWSETTQRSEAARIRSLLPLFNKVGFNPEAIYGELSGTRELGAYTIKTIFIRISKLFDFCSAVGVVSGPNLFKVFMTNIAPNKFKTANVYRPKTVPLKYEAVRTATESMDKVTRATIEFMINSGLRISEIYKVRQGADGGYYVHGKGGKIRQVLATPPVDLLRPWELRAALKQFSLTPHMLRKLTATRLAESGVTGSNLQQIFGWSSLNTAQRYIQETEANKLKQIMKEAL